MNRIRHFSLLDRICLTLDDALRALTNNVKTKGAPYPGRGVQEADLTQHERKLASSLMRINHAGEICAQALYHGQGVVSRNPEVQEKMQEASIEEGDHLAWCKKRLEDLDSHPSFLNPLWYAGSFCIGMMAGILGDEWSLGFVAETERQVVKHLESHLHLLPVNDQISYKILQQMEMDESKHHDEAIALGARELPPPIKQGMALTAKIMVKTAYYI